MRSFKAWKLLDVALALALLAILWPAQAICADANTTSSVTITKYAVDGTTINYQVTYTYQQLRDTLPVMGDGKTKYYHQGIVGEASDNMTVRWDENETANLKDYGALKGTRVDILCNQAGGMKEGDTLTFKAYDNWQKTFAYKNVYQFSSREGPMVLTWYVDGLYPDSGYDLGMRVVWFASDYGRKDGLHVFGNWDWHQAAEEQYWYYYYQNATDKYPTTSGLSGHYINRISINSHDPPYWDTNNDKTCDVGDMVVLGAKWGQSGAPGWIKEDVNRDGLINILDAVKLGMYWGKAY
jgi:hypothetical protein